MTDDATGDAHGVPPLEDPALGLRRPEGISMASAGSHPTPLEAAGRTAWTSGGDTGHSQNFEFEGWLFECAALPTGADAFQPVVRYRTAPTNEEKTLPFDGDPYATEAEAIRHAQQQAVRWVNDRTGNGQGQT